MMKILYAFQGTGNGHTARAIEVIPSLLNYAKVDVLISGTQADLILPFPVKHQYQGLGFVFGKNGGIDYYKTFKQVSLISFVRDIRNCPVEDYNLVINDFEPISAWASKLKGVPCIALSHQSALLGENIPKPKKKSWFAMQILKYYAPAQEHFSFHFQKYNKQVFSPVIRNNIRNAIIKIKKHYTIYLPAFSDEKLIDFFSKFPKEKWQLFSKEAQQAYSKKNIFVRPIDTVAFEKSMASSRGVVCGAGFETPAEALFLKKKLLVIPMKGQYEQQLNAAALKKMGVVVVKNLNIKTYYKFVKWIDSEKIVSVDYKDETYTIINSIIEKYEVIEEQNFHTALKVLT